ncbi:MAG: efflux RND transporter periplasmic adaptor subunit [Pirellulales bacterium]|nr:efflux RND transporter periplasmic adaptor subunit [Pirellulales bacterium]
MPSTIRRRVPNALLDGSRPTAPSHIDGSATRRMAIVLVTLLGLTHSNPAVAQIEGFTEPHATIDLAATENGVVASILVKEGETVSKGQLLATLDTDVLETTLEVARAQMHSTGKIDAAQADWRSWQSKLDKLRELRTKGHASQTELERAEADCAIAKARLEMAREDQAISALDYKRIEAQLERRRIRSPIDGIVLKVFKDAGEAILPTSPNVLTLVELDPLRARFSVPTPQAASLRPGSSVLVRFPETGRQAIGAVEFVSPVTDAKSGTVPVAVVLPNEHGKYRSGVRCVLEVPPPAGAGGSTSENSANRATAPQKTDGPPGPNRKDNHV